MSGYYGFSKSNNAIMAEEEGKFPLSKINKTLFKEYGIDMSLKDAKLLVKYYVWNSCEWHHTSKEYNKTYYYSLEELKEIEREEDFINTLKDVKSKEKGITSEEDEDVFYALIEVTSFYKSGGRWKPETTSCYAEVENWNSSSDFCTYNGNRKKKDNIDIVKRITKEKYDKMIKKEARESMLNLKRNILSRLEKSMNDFKNDEALKSVLEKIKNARTLKTLLKYDNKANIIINKLKAKEEEERKQNLLKKAQSKNIKKDAQLEDGIDLLEWVQFSQSVRHPAPKSVMQAKIESGMGWNAFERFLRENIKEAI